MTCDDVQPRLTAYLDGDLDPDRGTIVRGHLRTCEVCREIAARESVLRDELRVLPTVDPPSHLWSNIQHQLAAAEVAEAKRPGWKRALARWTPMLPRFAMGGVLAAAAAGILWWRTRPEIEVPVPSRVVTVPRPVIAASPEGRAVTIEPSPAPAPVAAACNLDAPAGTDVTADLAGEPARVTACYTQTATELLARAGEARSTWPDDQRQAFDAEVARLQQAITTADAGRPRQRAYRALNRYLQTTLTRDQVALASAP